MQRRVQLRCSPAQSRKRLFLLRLQNNSRVLGDGGAGSPSLTFRSFPNISEFILRSESRLGGVELWGVETVF